MLLEAVSKDKAAATRFFESEVEDIAPTAYYSSTELTGQRPSWRSELSLRHAILAELYKPTLQASEQGLRLKVTSSVKRAGFPH